MLIPRSGDRRRRRNPVALAIAGLIVAAVALSYGIGLTRDTIEVEDHSGSGIARGTVAVCGGRATLALTPSLVQHSAWTATPPRLCAGAATVTLTLRDGTVASCTAFHIAPGHDWRVMLTPTGCRGFEQATLPALP